MSYREFPSGLEEVDLMPLRPERYEPDANEAGR
jgi:hypothetical protein